MSTLTYIIQVYGSCSGYLLNMLQVQQNTAARHITNLPCITSTETLLKQCNWLSVAQLVVYHSLILFHKVLTEQRPLYIYMKIKNVSRPTRTTDELTIAETRWFKTSTANRSFIPRAIQEWNKLPLDVRSIQSKEFFKQRLKLHIKANIHVRQHL